MVLPSLKQNPSVNSSKCCLINLLREKSRHLLINRPYVKLFLTNKIIISTYSGCKNLSIVKI